MQQQLFPEPAQTPSAPFSQLSDVDVLAFTLEPAPRKLSYSLLSAFGSFAGTITASPERLAEQGVPPAGIRKLKLVEYAAVKLARAQIMKRHALTSWTALIDYVNAADAWRETEVFRVLFLDRKNVLIADEVMAQGTVDHCPVYPREIVKRALQLNASALILVHNHPSGDPSPSRADIVMTNEVVAACKALKIDVHDHLVIGRGGHASFKSLGLL